MLHLIVLISYLFHQFGTSWSLIILNFLASVIWKNSVFNLQIIWGFLFLQQVRLYVLCCLLTIIFYVSLSYCFKINKVCHQWKTWKYGKYQCLISIFFKLLQVLIKNNPHIYFHKFFNLFFYDLVCVILVCFSSHVYSTVNQQLLLLILKAFMFIYLFNTIRIWY
jgi:hypothetical protein